MPAVPSGLFICQSSGTWYAGDHTINFEGHHTIPDFWQFWHRGTENYCSEDNAAGSLHNTHLCTYIYIILYISNMFSLKCSFVGFWYFINWNLIVNKGARGFIWTSNRMEGPCQWGCSLLPCFCIHQQVISAEIFIALLFFNTKSIFILLFKIKLSFFQLPFSFVI